MNSRIQSIDIFRGITIAAMILVNTPGTWNHIYHPLKHAEWHGHTPTDMIFPFFLFIIGCSVSFALRNKKNESSTYKKISVRAFKLIILGIFLKTYLPFWPFTKVPYTGNEVFLLLFMAILTSTLILYYLSNTMLYSFARKTC